LGYGLVGAFRVITLLVGAEGSHIDPEKTIAGSEAGRPI
jgi:hypothetical protein